MKAVVITKFGGPEVLKIKEVDTPTCTGHQVLIAVKAAGMNRPDVFQRKGNYAAPEGAPADIPGLEISGEIVSIGELVDEWKLVIRSVLFYLVEDTQNMSLLIRDSACLYLKD
ncbi:alcohol dehydrogenase catalytic domain-containing protein [Sphingobacterium sp. IITKGP-BTPF85]|uniref:alcohol dehydrogenase catalytic domain-containing protein n=1 Tax=Sphingobacterium sp. IITKGP-BTPF85 TaxID=1338009 RepID=UPI0004018DFE|nr:alcohol dehydrogenase catalytic domain-containing protein [Sphingobacterium sp. IITKGP-BTPF85]